MVGNPTQIISPWLHPRNHEQLPKLFKLPPPLSDDSRTGAKSRRGTYHLPGKRQQNSAQVVIKQFVFAQSGSDWSGFKAYEREIQVLQGLDHPGIPHYLDSFETPAGFCMVQEYKNAQSLAVPRSFDPDEIKQIAISVLDILVYLQNRLPVVSHGYQTRKYISRRAIECLPGGFWLGSDWWWGSGNEQCCRWHVWIHGTRTVVQPPAQ
jgi:serine/threonine protein kinase